MDDFYFSVNLDNGRTLCLAPLTERAREMASEYVGPTESGYFLFEHVRSGAGAAVNVIARAVSYEAALEMRDMFGMS